MTPIQSIHRILALAALAATALLSQATDAQVSTYASRVNVPFAFECGGQHFAPGLYTIKPVNSNVLSVFNMTDAGFVIVQGDTEFNRPAQGYLTFRKYGNRYFLGEYHAANSLSSAMIPLSKIERSVAHDFEARKADKGRIRLALLDDSAAASSAR